MQSYFPILIFIFQNTQKGNQTLEMILLTIFSTQNDQIKLYIFFSSFPSHTAKIKGQGEQYRGGDGSKSQDM